MRAALESALSGGHEEQAGRAFARTYAGSGDDPRPEEAERSYGDAFAYGEEHDIGTFVVCLQGQRSAVLEQNGRWDECISLGHALLDQHRLSPWNRLRPLCSTAKVMARRGQEGFWPYLDEAMESAMRLGEPEWIRPVGFAEPRHVGWRAGWTPLSPNSIGCALSQLPPPPPGATAVDRCWMALWMRRLAGRAQAVDIEPFTSQLTGDGARAAALWDRLGYRYEAALALLDTKEDTDLRQLLTKLVDLGADSTARVVRRTMRDLGIRSIPTASVLQHEPTSARFDETRAGNPRTPFRGLVQRRDLSRLFISVRTVEHHVSAILGKPGTSTRKGAASEALKLGLTHPNRLSVTHEI